MQSQIDRLGKVSVTVEKDFYNNTKCYDKLVIVKTLGGEIYLSRKPVPSLISLHNKNYWLKLIPNDNLQDIDRYFNQPFGIPQLDENCKISIEQIPEIIEQDSAITIEELNNILI